MYSMTPDAWQRIKSIAASALEVEAADRTAYVERACAGDARLRDEVLSLLASADAATPMFEIPGGGAAPGLYAAARRLGAYRLIRELASGGMGTVYLAERDDGEFRQRVAIKIVRGGFGNAFLLERFRAERRILASLEHPNIARLLDGGTTDAGLPYVVMEFVEGEPIDLFCRHRELPLGERLAIFQQVCAAVQYAHQHLVVHRDIKPLNILVSADGIPKLLDFGIAKLLDAEAGESGAHTIAHVMTPESASPEQVLGQPVGIATDVYALGVLLYRVLTDESPYRAALDRGIDLTHAICEAPVDKPSAHAGGLRIPSDVDMIVLKALRKEPERRYASVEHFSDDLQRFLEGRPVLASPDSLRYRGVKFVGRHRVVVAAAATLAVALAGGIATTAWQARIANRERAQAQREFDAVRGLATAMLTEVTPAVEKLPGSTAAREIIIRRGTEYLDALAAEASADDGLRREIALGYEELAAVQGDAGLPNLGDREAARRSMLKGIAMIEPLARRADAAGEDRLRLAVLSAELADVEPAEATKRLNEAHSLLDSLTPLEGSTDKAIAIRERVWDSTANWQIRQRDYAGASVSQQHFLEAALERMRQAPMNLDASRNLALAYKTLGATLELLNRRPEALPLYAKALDLDQRRVAADPARQLWRLDLSFSYGAIGAALYAQDDFEGARLQYERAVALREQVVRQDPSEDFAKLALARGYDRMVMIWAALKHADTALDFSARARKIYRDRLEAHPERPNVWRDFSRAEMSDIEGLTELAPKFPPAGRRLIARGVGAMLDELQELKDRWARDKHAGELPPSAEDLHAQRARVAALK